MKFKSKIYLTYDDILSMTKNLEYEVSKVKPDLIVGIARGGLVPALHLSHSLDVPMEFIRWKTRESEEREFNSYIADMINQQRTVVFVDDINDSGRTFREIREMYRGGVYVALLEKTTSTFNSDIKILRMDDERWIVFPWEKD